MNLSNPTMSAAPLLLIACLITACSGGDTPPVATTAPVANSSVIANAGSVQSVFIGALVALNGSGSTTTNGTPLSYTWTMGTRPAGSAATLSSTSVVNPTFTADVAGTYECELVVSDGQQTSAPARVSITAAGTNPRPVANAGLNRSVFVGKLTSLDGSNSSDANLDPLSYRWTVTGRPDQSQALLFDANTVFTSITPDVAGLYVIQLIVNDGTSDSAPASVTITASIEPPPTANAGPNQIVLPNTQVTLNGSLSSDPGGDGLSFQWSLSPPAGVIATLTNSNTVSPTFTPPVAGAYTAQLIVTDSTGATSAPDTVLIVVGPRSDAGLAQIVSVGATVQLNGSGSFGDSLRYSWAFTPPLVLGSTAVFLPNNTVVNPSFVANVAGTYMITLTVTDSVGRSASATTTVTARTGPVANFTSAPTNPGVGATITLSNTSTGNSLAFTWAFALRPASSTAQFLPNASATSPSFVADRAGSYDVVLTARDTVTNAAGSVTRRITANNPPVAGISITQPSTNVCTTISLSGASSSDPDEFPGPGTKALSYLWSGVGPAGTIVFDTPPGPTVQNTSFIARTAGQYTVNLTVSELAAPQASSAPPASQIVSVVTEDVLAAAGHTSYHSGVAGISACQGCHTAGTHDVNGTPNIGGVTSISGLTSILRTPTASGGISHTGGKSSTITDAQIQQLHAFIDTTPCLAQAH